MQSILLEQVTCGKPVNGRPEAMDLEDFTLAD
jgi:hypothetical protein